MEYFLIARIEQTFGKEGFVRIQSFSDFPERFFSLKKVFIDFWGDKKSFYVEDVKDVKGRIIIKFKKFDSLRDSQTLIDREMFVDAKDAVNLPESYFFVHDLIDSDVFIKTERIGVVTDVIKSKSNDILVIRDDKKKEILIPFVLSFIDKFEVAKKKLILNISKEFLEEDED